MKNIIINWTIDTDKSLLETNSAFLVSKKTSNILLNTLNWIKDIIKKDISDYTNEDKNKLVFLMSEFSNFTLTEIKQIEDDIVNNFSFDNASSSVFFMLTIFMYYFDNNFFSQILELLSKIWYKNMEDFLLDKKFNSYIANIENLDEDCFYLIKSRIYSLETALHSIKLQDSLDSHQTDKFMSLSSSRLSYAISELEAYSNRENNKYLISYLNTVISYSNYDLPILFFDKENNKNLLTRYIQALENIFSWLSFDIISTLPDYSKTVVLNNIKFFIDLVSAFWDEIDLNILELYNYLKHNIDINKINWLVDFTKDYSGLITDYSNWYYFTERLDYKFFSALIDNIDIQDLISKLVIINKFSFHKTIKRFSWVFLDYLRITNKDAYLENYNQILDLNIKYTDEYLNMFISKINSVNNFEELKNLIKSFLIHFLDLPLNAINLDINIGFDFSSNFKLWVDYVNNESVADWYVISEVSDHTKLIILYFPKDLVDLNELNEKILTNIHKLRLFFDKIFHRLNNINTFLNKVEEKISLLLWDDVHNHKETLEHLKRVGDLYGLLLNNLKLNKHLRKLDIASWNLLLTNNELFSLIWKLHDIWKAYNIHSLQQYSNINARLYTFKNLYHFLTWFLWLDISFLDEKDNHGFFSQDKYLELLNNSSIFEKINKFFLKNKYNDLMLMLFTNYYTNSFFDLALSIYNEIPAEDNLVLIDNELWWLIKYRLLEKVSFIDKWSWYLSSKLKNIDINRLILAFIVVFDRLSFLYWKQLKEPHIRYWLQFFSMNKDFDYLNWTLFHHKDYPSLSEVKEYWAIDWLNKWKKIIWNENHNYFEALDYYINMKNRDFFMVLLTTVDILDALLSKRNYNEVDIDDNVIDFMKSFFTDSFSKYLISQVKWEDFSDKNETFDKVIWWLDNDFKENPYWPEIKSVLIEMKEDIISFYN